MSLKVWLPLNGDLTNNGTSAATIEASGATVNTSGKIGSCYSFDGSDDYISINCADLYSIIKGGTQPFSMTFWVYHADSTRAIIFGDYSLTGAINFNIELTTGHAVRFYWGGSPDKNFSTTVASAGWTHIALVYTGSAINIYKDGVKQSDSYSGALTTKTKTTGVYYLGRDSRTGTTVLNGRLNDFRIYDHVLSAKEIKEISQGLVLHYKLDDITNGIIDSSGYNNNGTIVGTCTAVESPPRYSAAISMNNTSTTNHIETANDITFSDNMSVSFWVKSALSNQVIFASKYIEFGILNSLGYVNPSASAGYQLSSYFTANAWNHICVVKNAGTFTLYVNGQKPTRNGANNNYLHNVDKLWILNRSYNSSYGGNGSVSDFRFYVTPLGDDDVLDLYHTPMSVDNLQNTHTFEFEEQDENVLAGIPWTSPYSTHSDTQNLFTNYNSNGEPQFTANSTSAGTKYIEITPGTYYYDTTISVNTGNQFYIGFERYDANKTARENQACAYIYTTKPSSNVVKQRYKGTVNLSTDGTNTLKYITLRILNGWSGTTSGVTGQATVHNLSLRLVSDAQTPKIKRTGEFVVSELKEDTKSSLYKNDMVEAAEFIER